VTYLQKTATWDYFNGQGQTDSFGTKQLAKRWQKGGQLDTLIWLRENGCPWDSWTVHWAACNGQTEGPEVGERTWMPSRVAECLLAIGK